VSYCTPFYRLSSDIFGKLLVLNNKLISLTWYSMDLKKLIGNRITTLRKEKGLSQQKLSVDAGLERSHLTNIENGNKNISLSTLEKIFTALDTNPSDFFNAEEFSKK
jgi:DNA-binding Xre family transcriptional regulator